MKILIINGSPMEHGSVGCVLDKMTDVLIGRGLEVERIHIGTHQSGCRACGACAKLGYCPHGELVAEASRLLRLCDGVVIGSPVYYSSPNGSLIAFLDRLFQSSRFDKTMKVGACFVTARRAGGASALDGISKYFAHSAMAQAYGSYPSIIYTKNADTVELDREGVAAAISLAENVAFLTKAVALGKEALGLPQGESRPLTDISTLAR